MHKNTAFKYVLSAFLLFPAFCTAAPLVTTYRDNSGTNKPVTFTTSAKNPNISKSLTYKDNTGQWRPVTVTEQICGTDGSGNPLSCDGLETNMINVPNGIAGLDQNSRVTSSILTDSVVTGQKINDTVVPTVYNTLNPQLTANGNGPFYWWDGNSIMRMGGMPVSLPHNSYATNSQSGNYQSIILNGVPTGGYNAGCSMCIFMEPSSIKQAAISAVDTAQSGGIPSADGVGLFTAPVNSGFDLVLPVTSYTATSVTISDTLTAAELAHIQPMMTIFTNSQIPGVTPADTEDADYYMGVVKSVSTVNNVTTINVYGWGRQLKSSTGDVPSTTSLESTFWSNRTTPVVGVGGFNKAFARNEFMVYDGTRGGGTGNASTSVVRSYSGDEMDMIISNETRANKVKFIGYVINLSMDPNHTSVLTHDSMGFYAGGNTPRHFMAGDSCYPDGSGYYDQSSFEGAGVWIGGACQLGQLETSLNRYDQEVAEFDGRSTGAADFRLMYHIAETTKGQGTAATNILPHLGIIIGGSKGAGVDTGSAQADIEWNWNGLFGGFALCGNDGTTFNCGVAIDSKGVPRLNPNTITGGNGAILGNQPSGHVAGFGQYFDASYNADLLEVMKGTSTEFALSPTGDATFGGNVTTGQGGQFILTPASGAGVGVGNYMTTDGYANMTVHAANGGTSTIAAGRVLDTTTYTLAAMPGAQYDGEHAWCSDCKLNGITGVEAYWHSSVSKWTDSQNNALTQ